MLELIQAVFLDLVKQGLVADPQGLSRHFAVPVRLPEGLLDDLPLRSCGRFPPYPPQGKTSPWIKAVGILGSDGRAMFYQGILTFAEFLDRLFLAKENKPLDDIFQLPDVSRPLIAQQVLFDTGRRRASNLAVFRCVQLEKMPVERDDLLAPFPQGGGSSN